MPADRGQNLREILYGTGDFCQIVREERNYAAILYSALLSPKNRDAFLQQVYAGKKAQDPSVTLPAVDPDSYGCFFEYAHLRDAWYCAGDTNDKRFEALKAAFRIIGDLTIKDTEGQEVKGLKLAANELTARLSPLYRKALDGPNFAAFNGCFKSNPSKKYLQSPGTWQARWIMGGAEADEGHRPSALKAVSPEARKLLVILGWCFNAKPDLVIHLNGSFAICVEIKVDSPEGGYQAEDPNGDILRLRQTEIQKVIMELLGFTAPILVSIVLKKENKVGGRNSVQILWSQLFSPDGKTNGNFLDLSGVEPFVFRLMDGLHAHGTKKRLRLARPTEG